MAHVERTEACVHLLSFCSNCISYVLTSVADDVGILPILDHACAEFGWFHFFPFSFSIALFLYCERIVVVALVFVAHVFI